MRICYIYAAIFFSLVYADSPSENQKVNNTIEESLNEEERITYQAIKAIHMQLDDDRSGTVDHSESVEFLMDELKSKDKNRHNHFHGNDSQISVEDLWASWKQSEVHNWTQESVVSWLVKSVKLPEYVDAFTRNKVDGKLLPHLAIEANGFMQKQLGITNPKHKKKISLRAADVVLFGPNVIESGYLKDIILLSLLLLATATAWYAIHEKKRSKHQMAQMMKDVDCLQQAEQDLLDLQEKLANAEEEQLLAQRKKIEMESKLKEEISSAKHEAARLHRERQLQNMDQVDVQLLERELQETKRALAKVETEAEILAIKSPHILQQWLQMTYKKEGKHFQLKKQSSLRQMEEAKSACDKINKKRSSLLGSFRLAQGQSIDEVDHKILNARSALAELTNDLQERQHRWQQIELQCGFQIVNDNIANNNLRLEPPNSSIRRSSISQALAACGNAVGIATINPIEDVSNRTGPNDVNIQRVLSCPVESSESDFGSNNSLSKSHVGSLSRVERRLLTKQNNQSQGDTSQSDDALIKARATTGDTVTSQYKSNRNTWCVSSNTNQSTLADINSGTQEENISSSSSVSTTEDINVSIIEDINASSITEDNNVSTPKDVNVIKRSKRNKIKTFLSRKSNDEPKRENSDDSISSRTGSLKRSSLMSKFKSK